MTGHREAGSRRRRHPDEPRGSDGTGRSWGGATEQRRGETERERKNRLSRSPRQIYNRDDE
jgi:hypothetical protein